jgi:hypothetical protein
MTSKLGWATVVILLVAAGFFLNRSMLNERRLQEQLLTSLNEVERSKAEFAKFKAAQVDSTEMERLRADQREALKLRGEVTRLKQDLATAEKMAKSTKANPGAASNSSKKEPSVLELPRLPVDNPDVAVHQTRVIETTLPANSVLALGGWVGESGKRIFAFVEPSQEKTNPDQVSIATTWIEVSEETAKKIRVGGFLDQSGEQFATLNGSSIAQIKEEIEKAGGGDILSTPNVTSLSGRQARVSISEARTTPGGQVELGPNVDVVPVVAEDGSGITVTMKASLVESRNKATAQAN